MEYRYYLAILACFFIVFLLTSRKKLEIEKEEKQQDNSTYKIVKIARIVSLIVLLLAGIYFVGYSMLGLLNTIVEFLKG
ncbi:hypothetical protein [Dysgonomonas sp. 25]|uniref:hypothetical protein n=1 Tax=Dysgonomonas sp. 25 TaxID=2302933 RepID=UPI001C86E3AF|nr:hypothetical protein [Dysgonomonas sp. 25]NDV68764.1 hypothetical protein [Dysgonomonas sp. 25]